MFTTSKNASFQAEVLSQARFFSHRLEDFLAPFLVQLDRLLDHRLVLTFQALCQALVRHRSRSSGLLLSELGGVLLSPHKAPAGTKRLSNLLRSKKWSAEAITDYLTGEAQTYVDRLLEQERELPLLLWDESVQEKTESIKSQGLCAVRSMKARRQLRVKPGYYDPPTRQPVHVPGFRWVGLLCCGLWAQPRLARFTWWTSRGINATSLEQVRLWLLLWARQAFGRAVLHVFDRGYASSRWLGLLLARGDRFLLRWPSRYKLLDVKGLLKNGYRFSVGKKATSSKVVRDMVRQLTYRRSLLWQRCLHPDYPDCPLTLIICRPGRKGRPPWYLLTNEEVHTDRDAWRLVFAYARRWQVEQAFRFNKAEMGMESCRLWFWDNRMKLLQIVTLVYAFLLSLLEKELRQAVSNLLRQGCHRTGKRCRKTPTPLYRIRLALANLWNLLYLSLIQTPG
ncbi:transposase [Pontibacter sp. HSC-14F20]|uniref:transposase n=2 Tax=Pontibacter sp. HSC-14F20 TaxID=2864136 RepID=UPI001C73678D|nr:transposase [Pontibacter sp. HSC-14F20]MBX0331655.1 transposase [Pontibacter sp. HSC-14F20]MBX0334841.1 transposase [Pontibacter sp. HSC-14F20]